MDETEIIQQDEFTELKLRFWVRPVEEMAYQVEVVLSYDGVEFMTREGPSNDEWVTRVPIGMKLQNPRIIGSSLIAFKGVSK